MQTQQVRTAMWVIFKTSARAAKYQPEQVFAIMQEQLDKLLRARAREQKLGPLESRERCELWTHRKKKRSVKSLWYNTPGWSPRGNQRWTALFHSFDVFERWFREHDKHQRWSALFQCWSALIFSESALFRTEKFSAVSELNSAVSERNSSESALFSADFICSETLDFQRWTALIQRWFTLNQLWYLHM